MIYLIALFSRSSKELESQTAYDQTLIKLHTKEHWETFAMHKCKGYTKNLFSRDAW